MSVTVRGQAATNAEALFALCQATDATRYVSQLRDKTVTSFADVQEKKMIGTIDATSCLGICYQTASGDVFIQHHDGRPSYELVNLFGRAVMQGEKPLSVHIVGGCSQPNPQGEFKAEYQLLEKFSKENVESIVQFWKSYRLKIDVQGWALGQTKAYETLFPDFVADASSVQLTKPGLVGTQNLVPEVAQRMVATVEERYLKVYDSAQGEHFSLPDVSHLCKALSHLPKTVEGKSDREVLETCSTTPTLEPPYFCDFMRQRATYIQKGDTQAKKVAVPKGPVLILQGEVGALRSPPK